MSVSECGVCVGVCLSHPDKRSKKKKWFFEFLEISRPIEFRLWSADLRLFFSLSTIELFHNMPTSPPSSIDVLISWFVFSVIIFRHRFLLTTNVRSITLIDELGPINFLLLYTHHARVFIIVVVSTCTFSFTLINPIQLRPKVFSFLFSSFSSSDIHRIELF